MKSSRLALLLLVPLAMLVSNLLLFKSAIPELLAYVLWGAILAKLMSNWKIGTLKEILIVVGIFAGNVAAYLLDPVLKSDLDRIFSANTVDASTTWINLLIGFSFVISYAVARIIFRR